MERKIEGSTVQFWLLDLLSPTDTGTNTCMDMDCSVTISLKAGFFSAMNVNAPKLRMLPS
jgi:hypothetical protein